MRVAPEIVLADEERAELKKLARSRLTSIWLAQRARIVLLAVDGMIADNYVAHKRPAVQVWLVKYSRFNMHFTATSTSWLNMLERFFRDLTTERLRRGVFTHVPGLIELTTTSLTTTQNQSRSSGPRAPAISCRRSSAPIAA